MGGYNPQKGWWFGKWSEHDPKKDINAAMAQDAAKRSEAPPPPPDITDKAVQAKRREEEFRTGSGSRRNSFITGPLGDNTSIPVLGKSIITGG